MPSQSNRPEGIKIGKKRFSLRMLGALFIIGGLLAGVIMRSFPEKKGLSRAQRRGAAAGRASAQALFMVAGVVMIATDLVRGRKRAKGEQQPLDEPPAQ